MHYLKNISGNAIQLMVGPSLINLSTDQVIEYSSIVVDTYTAGIISNYIKSGILVEITEVKASSTYTAPTNINKVIVNFYPAVLYRCAIGTPSATVHFKDYSYGLSTGTQNTWLWTITPNNLANASFIVYQNGTTSSSKNPIVSFGAIDSYSVSLSATNTTTGSTGFCSKPNIINVSALVYTGSFVSPGFVEAGFVF
jgi:hypothetical protein